jgi:hypothetical protein
MVIYILYMHTYVHTHTQTQMQTQTQTHARAPQHGHLNGQVEERKKKTSAVRRRHTEKARTLPQTHSNCHQQHVVSYRATANTEVAFLPPVRVPAVLDLPKVNAVLGAPTNHFDGMAAQLITCVLRGHSRHECVSSRVHDMKNENIVMTRTVCRPIVL